MSVEDEVRDIKAQISRVQGQKARAEVERDQARAAAEQIRSDLSGGFGVETPEDARRVLGELEADLERTLNEARQALERTQAL